MEDITKLSDEELKDNKYKLFKEARDREFKKYSLEDLLDIISNFRFKENVLLFINEDLSDITRAYIELKLRLSNNKVEDFKKRLVEEIGKLDEKKDVLAYYKEETINLINRI